MKTQVSSFAAPAKRMMPAVGAAFLALALCLAPATAFAQGSDTGSVRGAVMDEQDRPVANAQITITNTDNGYSRSMQTDDSGNYVFQSLPVGPYTL